MAVHRRTGPEQEPRHGLHATLDRTRLVPASSPMSDLHPNAARVMAAAGERGVVVEIRRFPDGTRTAVDAAAAIGVDVGQILKSLIFEVDGEVVLAYVSGTNQLDEQKLAGAAGGVRCDRVDADAVRAATGYPIGGVPPFGHATPLRVFVDPDLLVYDEAWAAAGTPHDVFGIAPAELVRASGGNVTALKR
ncbi:MAG: YbaK/EbsC family protein [Acidimicrobiales bacterium]